MKQKVYAALAIFISILILIPMLTFSTACTKAGTKEPITIGVILPLTGFLLDPGICHNQGLIVGIENAPSEIAGRPLNFIVEDDASDPAQALDKIRKLIETDKACMIIGPLHGGALMGIADYAAKMKVPVLTVHYTSNDLAMMQPWIWQCDGTMEQGTSIMGAYAYDVLGYRTATTLTMDYSAGYELIGGFQDVFKAKGGQIIQEQLYPPATMDYSSYITSLKKADVVCAWTSMGAQQMNFIRQYREFGVDMPLIASEGQPECSYCKDYGDLAMGWPYSSTYVYVIDTPESKNFVEAFKKKWNGDLPGPMSASAYLDVQIALEALRGTGGDTSGDALAKVLDEIKINGPAGPLTFQNRLGSPLYRVAEVEKVGGEYIPRILATYTVAVEKVGDKLINKPTQIQ